ARNINSFSHIANKYPKHCYSIEGDITDDSVSDKIENTIKSNSNKIDVLINNAGNAEKCFGIDNVTPQHLDNHFRVHVSGAFRIIKTCIPFLQKSDEPLIINISSRKGSINRINSGAYRILFPYQIAKCAQNMLTACLNQELKETNIKTFAIHPGNLKTDVAPPDADTEPIEASLKLFEWINSNNKPSTSKFYSITDDTILEW
ncbi:SDR family NAD(P)-dependent oxidoreductase, partial [Bacteroidota bacterium]